MAALLTPETFEFFARYLVAGYIVIFVRSAFVAGLRPKPAELLIEAVVLSLLVQLFTTALSWLIAALTPSLIDGATPELGFAVRILVVPACFGALLGVFLRSNWRNGVLRRLSLPVVHPVRKAHDFAFGNNRAPGLVEITYNDGTKIGGWFGVNSLAATDDARSDLYLERAYVISDEGTWTEPSQPRAVLLSLKDVRSIEFLLQEEDANE